MANIDAHILNIEGLGNIEVFENGQEMESIYYTWDANSKILNIQQDVYKSSVFMIKATNNDGSVSQSITVTCPRNN